MNKRKNSPSSLIYLIYTTKTSLPRTESFKKSSHRCSTSTLHKQIVLSFTTTISVNQLNYRVFKLSKRNAINTFNLYFFIL